MPSSQTTPTVTTYTPKVGVPTRKTSETELDTFNQQLRSSPLYQNFMKQRGLRTDGHVKLSSKQQKELETAMARAGFTVPSGMHIDQGGNLNQKNRLLRNVGIAAAIAGGTIATLGAAGAFAPAALAPASAAGGAAAVPGAVGGSAITAASQAAAMGLGVPTVTGGAGAAAAAAGAAPVLASTVPAGGMTTIPAVAGGGGSGMSVLGSIGKGLAKVSGDKWLDVGALGMDFLSTAKASSAANAASDRSADLQYKTSQELMALEREKEARRQYEWGVAEEARKRNQQVDEENRLEDLRQLEQKEAQGEPRRVAKENAYRAYMKHYWGIDVAPTVARTARQIQSGTPGSGKEPVVAAPPVSTKMPVSSAAAPAPLSALVAAPAIRTEQFTGPTTLAPQSIAFAEDPQYLALRRQRESSEEMA